jgi:outer membrane protein OmpA-like peptidoglycan-associated protein
MITFILTLNLILRVQKASVSTVRRHCSMLSLYFLFSCAGVAASAIPSSITYATRLDAVTWVFEGSKFSCQINHNVDDFGTAMFERKAGVSTRFFLQSQSPRMKSGKADLISQPPPWLASEPAITLSAVNVQHGETPVTVKRKTSERMLAELQKGMDLHIVRQPWYGDKNSLIVVVPSVGFGDTYRDYLACLRNLLPVNYSQIEKRSLYYGGIEELRSTTVKYLQKVAAYVKEDPAVKVVYIDGHTDSVGVRADNLEKSKERATLIVNYLVENGVRPDMIVARWHGERYQVATNQTSKGRAKNRRVTVRLSKEPPHNTIDASKPKASASAENTAMADMTSPPKQ